jgi:hypothetical protein
MAYRDAGYCASDLSSAKYSWVPGRQPLATALLSVIEAAQTCSIAHAQRMFLTVLRGRRSFFAAAAFAVFVLALILPARFLTRVVIFCTCAVGATVLRLAAFTFLRIARFTLPATVLGLLAAVWAVRARCLAPAFAAWPREQRTFSLSPAPSWRGPFPAPLSSVPTLRLCVPSVRACALPS